MVVCCEIREFLATKPCFSDLLTLNHSVIERTVQE